MGQQAAKAATAGGPRGVEDRFHLVGTLLDGKFKIDRVVAEGGFAVVYQGVHLSLERTVAVKVLKTPAEFNDEAREEFIDKFRFEAKTIARISHPNIVQVVEFGVATLSDGVRAPYMVLEWLNGQTLDQTLRARRLKGGRGPEEVITVLRPVFEALAYAHDEGIAHRDIKPANMILVDGRRGVSLRLLDFGIAKIMDEHEEAGSGMTQTRTAMQAFSPKYSAPEQIGGARSGPWTDVHALGLIVTEMLTDMPPYDGRDITQRFAEALSPTRPTPKKRKIDVGSWESVIARAVSIIPDERYPNAGEFLKALTEALPGATHRPFSSPLPEAAQSTALTLGDTTLSKMAVSTDLSPDVTLVESSRRPLTALLAIAFVALLAAVGVGARTLFSPATSPVARPPSITAPTTERVPTEAPPRASVDPALEAPPSLGQTRAPFGLVALPDASATALVANTDPRAHPRRRPPRRAESDAGARGHHTTTPSSTYTVE